MNKNCRQAYHYSCNFSAVTRSNFFPNKIQISTEASAARVQLKNAYQQNDYKGKWFCLQALESKRDRHLQNFDENHLFWIFFSRFIDINSYPNDLYGTYKLYQRVVEGVWSRRVHHFSTSTNRCWQQRYKLVKFLSF